MMYIINDSFNFLIVINICVSKNDTGIVGFKRNYNFIGNMNLLLSLRLVN